MPSRFNREAERNIRTNDFLQENKTDFTANAFVTGKIAELKTELETMGDKREEQISSDGGARQNYDIAEEANDSLKELMQDVADLAVTMGDDIEGIEEKFRFTRTGGKRARLARARAFATDALEHRAMFVERGLESNFIDELNARADALEQALENAVSKTAARVGAVESKMQSHKKQKKIIEQLDPIIRRHYRDNPAKLAAWEFASKIQRDEQPKTKPPTA
ncbi:MAG: hypothetical protein LUM44_00180 [Pyrinomonadaceae bacterium]|nr:hypothetical protein [Pyrinomonadaceae bacterium]